MSKRILIVEDSPTQSLLLSSLLEDSGFEVVAASDGLAAIALLAAELPQLVISDVNMPGMDGYQLCRAIRADARLEDLPILLLTSLADEEEVLTGLEAGADAFITKPFDHAVLLERIGDLIAGTWQQETAKHDPVYELLFAGRKYKISASRSRILRYLVSTYDSALQVNARLAESEAELHDLNAILEEKVQARTASLSQEVEQRTQAQHSLQVTNRLLEIANNYSGKEYLLRDFLAEVISFSGNETVVIRLRDQEGADPPELPGGSGSEARIPIKLGDELFGHILLAGKEDEPIAQETVNVLETVSTQLAAALQRIEAGETLRESEEKYRRFFEDDLAGAMIITPEGEITSCNPAFSRMFGFSDDVQAIGSSVVSLYSEPKEWYDFLALLRREGKIAGREAEYRRRDGAPVFVIESAVAKFDDAGNPTEVRRYLVDITEKKSLEHQLFQSQKMEAIGRLAGGVAHDFNNILQVIQGFTDHLLTKTPEEDPRHAWLKQVRVATEKAAALVQGLLAFSRKQAQHKVLLSLNDVILEIAPMLSQLIGARIKLNLKLSPDLGKVEADRNHVDQILMNLAGNARDAMPDGGALTLETSDVELQSVASGLKVEEVKSGPYVLLSVRDTGTGMDRETMEHMFEPFFTTKEVGKGTGLGLATVYGVVRQAEGHVTCSSVLGEGTEFKIHLPLAGGA
jgi:PAS domain S-box-containing protein